MILNVYTDGGALNNPGPAASSYLIYQDKKLLTKGAKFLGKNTNNFAEYMAVVLAYDALKNINRQGAEKIIFHSDSNLLVNQLNGLFKIKNNIIREFVFKIRELEGEINLPVVYKYIPREQNTEADSLVKQILISKH